MALTSRCRDVKRGVSRSLLTLRGDAGANDTVFASRKGGRLTARAVHGMVKRTAARAGVNAAISPHWLRHAHGSHAIDKGAPLHEVQATLGHANVTTTSGYLHARPGSSSGLKLDPGVFLHEIEDSQPPLKPTFRTLNHGAS
jgi:integrase